MKKKDLPEKPKHGQLVFDEDTKKLWSWDAEAGEWVDFDEVLGRAREAMKTIAKGFENMSVTIAQASKNLRDAAKGFKDERK